MISDIDPGGEALDAALRAADPFQTVDMRDAELQSALDALGERLVQDEPASTGRERRWTRQRGLIAGGVIAAVLVAGTPAAAQWIRLHTGRFEQNGSYNGELLDTSSPELGAYLDKLARPYPLPPGHSFEPVKKNLARPDTLTQRASLEGTLTAYAVCQWTDEWLAAHDVGDRARMANAQRVFHDATTWKALGNPGEDLASYKRLEKAARLGDAYSLRYELRLCTGPWTGQLDPDPMPSYLDDGYLDDVPSGER